jgi:hypothetical protein
MIRIMRNFRIFVGELEFSFTGKKNVGDPGMLVGLWLVIPEVVD